MSGIPRGHFKPVRETRGDRGGCRSPRRRIGAHDLVGEQARRQAHAPEVDPVERRATQVGAVERLADEDLMRQTRVCGLNGSLLVTCYGGSATVSLRPSQIGDGCS